MLLAPDGSLSIFGQHRSDKNVVTAKRKEEARQAKGKGFKDIRVRIVDSTWMRIFVGTFQANAFTPYFPRR